MKTLVYEFRNEDAFKTFARLINFSLEHLRQLAVESDILQARLILSIVDDIYKNKILIKLIKEPEVYQITLKAPEVMALKLLLKNYDFLKAPSPFTMALMSDVNGLIDEYLTNNPVKIKQPCVNLLNSATNESKLSIKG